MVHFTIKFKTNDYFKLWQLLVLSGGGGVKTAPVIGEIPCVSGCCGVEVFEKWFGLSFD